MTNTVVRLEGITIEQFKNVEFGQLNFSNKRKPYRASVLGLYGQNGSGKTALIDAIELLKYALQGIPLPEKFAHYINVKAECAVLTYEFSVSSESESYRAWYSLELHSELVDSPQNTFFDDGEETVFRPVIKNEVLKYSYESGEVKERKTPLIDTSSDNVFGPETKYACLLGSDKNLKMNLMVEKKLALGTSRSFVFSRGLLTAINEYQDGKASLEYQRHVRLLESLVRYGNYELFVINTANSGIISMDVLPLSFKYEQGARKAAGSMLVPLENAVSIPHESVAVVETVISNMNIVLSQIVPGLTIKVEKLGEMILKSGEKGVRIQLLSMKNDKAIPLKYESEGTKKIISVLQLLIVVFNRPSITVAIDELDAGIFEYLLGEILRIISEKGRGQLLFTSHNLRPLETLDRGFIAFTTANPGKRYLRMGNVKDNNNLRDLYFREIILGGQSEEFYVPTNNAEIALAFHEAGDGCGA